MWCVCVYISAPVAINLWNDMEPIYLVKNSTAFMAVVVGIISGHSISIDTHYRIQSNRSKLALHKPSIHFNSHLKQT